MNKKLLFSLACLLAFAVLPVSAQKKLHTIGDSTMDGTYDVATTDKRGWCMMLQSFFDKTKIVVDNRGKSGASSKTFYTGSAYWPTMVTGGTQQMSEGDYLIIQFAHNDEKNNGVDGEELRSYYKSIGDDTNANAGDDNFRGTSPFNTYKSYLRKFIDEAKAMGVKPIVVGAICRKYFSSDGKDITRSGRHDLGDKYDVLQDGTLLTGQKVAADDDTYDYTVAAKAVADEYDDVPFIDLTDLTAKLYLSYGDAYCTSNLFCSGDKTHLAALGATLVSRTFAQALKDQYEAETDAKKKEILKGLADYVVVSNDMTFNPSNGNMGEAYVGMNVVKEYNISAFGLVEKTGEFTISASDGFQVSTDKATWSDHVNIAYTGGNLVTTVFVKADITAAGTIAGTLTASDGTNSNSLNLTASGKELVGGVESTCVWPLHSSDGTAISEVLTGSDVTTYGMTMMAKQATPTAGVTTDKMQMFDIEGSTWPGGEIDEVATRYIEFKATVPVGKIFNLDKISFNLCGWGGNAACCKAYYATKDDFSDQVNFAELKNLTNKNSVEVTTDAIREVVGGENIYVRVYPWLNYSKDATGKYIALSDVTIHGVLTAATDIASAVSTISSGEKNSGVYSITGQKLYSAPCHGIYIENGMKKIK